MRTAGRMLALVAAALLLAGCGIGNDIRDYLEDTYQRQSASGDTATYASHQPVGTTTGAIVGAMAPIARAAEGGSEYLRYDDDIVIVSNAAGGGSTVRVEDLDDRYASGFFVFLGPGFRPGSPAGAGSGGPGDIK